MSYLENPKTYTGTDLETIFFRPMLSGPSAEQLGIRILYNMPVPTTIQLWDAKRDILQKYTAAGWNGGTASRKYQKTIRLSRVKAELGFSAADYFSMVYELITGRPDVNMDDLSGTELEKAETELFRRSIAEGIRVTMWIGDTTGTKGYNTFDGFLKPILAGISEETVYSTTYTAQDLTAPAKIIDIFETHYANSVEQVKDLKAEGQLAYFVTSDLYHLYERYLDSIGAEAAYRERIQGRDQLAYHGIPVVDIRLTSYLTGTSYHKSFGMLTDRRNLVLAVNTSDFPGNEIRMWYNPDLMENRQRAVFMAGCEVLDEALISYAHLAAS